MDIATFLYLLHEEIALTKHSGKKHMIRFSSAKDYYAYKAELRRLRPRLANLAKVRVLDIIHAFSCTLRPDSKLKYAAGGPTIVEDSKITVHQIIGNKTIAKRATTLSGSGSHAIPWGVDQIGAPEVWNKSLGQNIRIGVIDTGIDYNHPDLRNSISRGINLLNHSMLPYDDNGHGTHIAGTIAATGRNSGIIGVAPRAIIHPVKAFDHSGSAYVSDIIAGIDWCVSNDLDIINMSFGMKSYNRALEQAVLNAYYRGKVIVASSGNDGKRKTVDYPARFPQVVSVGATTRQGRIAPFSNRGKQIDIYAPGERVYSSWLHGKYNELSGTSMATAHVSGVIALMLAIKPMAPQQIKTAIRRCAISLNRRENTRWQPGHLNARRALRAAKQL
ncbi:S8 family peptidase [Paenibacillus sp. GCM10023248]|uniref:S8 family peptidase n=1 Tax=Bacillales TaxID=1385 RepID=UPI0023785D13|nr:MULTISPECIES: S8 family peptidase [Bacillales]MDD9270559.1 S8 family peptidase [Paenibacillus sp. MAHUQ-63]MDR6885472.1 subtilisin [Bacillus sp. 3255]